MKKALLAASLILTSTCVSPVYSHCGTCVARACPDACSIERPALNEDVEAALNAQLKLELESSYLYLGMSTYFSQKGLGGFAHWFKLQSEEEYDHAMKVYNFMLDRGVTIHLPDLAGPKFDYSSPIHAVEVGLAHEIHVSQTIKDIYGLAQDAREYDTAEFVLWFLKEQVEEENLFEGILTKLRMLENAHPAALLFLDYEMAQRAAASGGCGC